MKIKIILLAIPLLFLACNKKKAFSGPQMYSDSFENYEVVEDLVDGENELWSFFQVTLEGNSIDVDSINTHSGARSMRFFALPTTSDKVSKSSINKQFMAFWEGETVVAEFWCYIADTDDIDWMFIFDLEEKVPVGAGPGMRIAIVENRLLLEHKYPNPNVEQTTNPIDFPRNEWVKVKMETLLSRKKKGYVRIWQNDQLVLTADNWKTLPKDILYAQQGTKGGYSQIEFGITANADDQEHVLYVDDVNVYTLP